MCSPSSFWFFGLLAFLQLLPADTDAEPIFAWSPIAVIPTSNQVHSSAASSLNCLATGIAPVSKFNKTDSNTPGPSGRVSMTDSEPTLEVRSCFQDSLSAIPFCFVARIHLWHFRSLTFDCFSFKGKSKLLPGHRNGYDFSSIWSDWVVINFKDTDTFWASIVNVSTPSLTDLPAKSQSNEKITFVHSAWAFKLVTAGVWVPLTAWSHPRLPLMIVKCNYLYKEISLGLISFLLPALPRLFYIVIYPKIERLLISTHGNQLLQFRMIDELYAPLCIKNNPPTTSLKPSNYVCLDRKQGNDKRQC